MSSLERNNHTHTVNNLRIILKLKKKENAEGYASKIPPKTYKNKTNNNKLKTKNVYNCRTYVINMAINYLQYGMYCFVCQCLLS